MGREGKGVGREEKEKQNGCQVSTTKPPSTHTIPPHPIPTPRLAWEGGAVTPQHPPPPSAAPLQPETEPRWLSFEFFTQTPLPSSCFATARPHCCRRLVRATVPPPRTFPHRHSTRRAQSPSPPRILRAHRPTTTTTWYVPPPDPQAPSPLAVPHGAP